METLDLIALAKQCPDVTISVKASDLISWGRSLKEELLQDLRDSNLVKTKKEVEDFITREEAMEKLKVSSATLWRWKKSDYLVPRKTRCAGQIPRRGHQSDSFPERRCLMSQPKHISEVLHQLVLNNPNDPYAQILRHCPFMQIELLKEGYMTLDELTPEEKERLSHYIDLEDLPND